MEIEFTRTKKNNLLLRAAYLMHKLAPFSLKWKLKFYLTLEWIFTRLARESAHRFFINESGIFRANIHDFLLNQVQPQQSVLDLGCGFGEKSFHLAAKALQVTGIDKNQLSIIEAQRRYKKENLTYITGDAYDFLKQNKKPFDILILSHILEHLENRKDFIMKYKSFFKMIYIEVPDFESADLNIFRKAIDADLQYSDDDHVVEYGRESLINLITDCGLSIMEREYIFGVQKYWCKTDNK